jgi:uncharacterized protein YndB with AHSA1/START domain
MQNRIIKSLIWLLVAIVVGLVGGGYVLPSTAVVQRQIVINAPPEKVFAIVGNMKRFNEWSPWFGMDPKAQYTFEGPETGVGQIMRWTSNDPNVGNGSQTITALDENRRTSTELDFGEMGKAVASLEIAEVNGKSAVTWGFKSELNGILERWFGLMFDRWIGPDYEKGLNNLKALAET